MEAREHYPNLEVGHLFGVAWPLFKENLGLILAIVLVNMVAAGISDPAWYVTLLVTGPLTAGSYYVYLRLVRGQHAEFAQILEGFREFLRALGVYLLMMLVVGLGFVALIIPGIILAIGLIPAMYLVTDSDAGVVDTLKNAWAITKGHKGQLFVVGLALIGINILGLLALGIGILFSIGLSNLVIAAAYNELVGRPELDVSAEEEEGLTAGESDLVG